MFLGYYKSPEASAADMKDGWMQSGDAGYFNDNKQLVVIDRIKDLAETARGERFSPQYIENKLKFSPYIAETVVLGAGRDALAAMICIRFSIISKWAEKNRISFTTYTDLASRPEVYALLRKEVEAVNATLPPAQRISKFLLLYKELDADDGELTRTRKVRRSVINEKYAAIIDAIYGGERDIPIDTVIRFQDGTTQRIRTTLAVVDSRRDARGGGGRGMNTQFLIQLLVNGLVVGTLYGVVAMSFVLIYKATQVVNFAQGELLLIGAWVCWALLTKYQVPFWVGMPITLVFMFVFGIAIQVVILRPMIGEPIISVIMVTIGLSTVFQAALKWIFGVNPQPFPRVFTSQSVNLLGLQIQTVYVMSLVVSVAMMIGMAWFFRVSKYGLAMRATAFNQQVAQSLGISVKSVFAMAWAISATVSAVAGVVVAVVNGVSSGLSAYGIKVFPAAILGGLDIDRRRRARRHHHRAAGKLRAICRQRISALGQSLRDRAVLRADHHPDDQAVRPVRHQRHRAGVISHGRPDPHSRRRLPHHLRGGHHDLPDHDQPQRGDRRHHAGLLRAAMCSANTG